MKTVIASTLSAALVTAVLIGPMAVTPAMASDDDRPGAEEYEDDDDHRRGGWFHHRGHKGGHKGGHGMRALMHAFGGKNRDLQLTEARLKEIAEGFIALSGNENITVGDIATIDDKALRLAIVTKDGSLVEEFSIDRKTGRPTPIR